MRVRFFTKILLIILFLALGALGFVILQKTDCFNNCAIAQLLKQPSESQSLRLADASSFVNGVAENEQENEQDLPVADSTVANATNSSEYRILPDWSKIKQELLASNSDFIEADLENMLFKFYERGSVAWESPILKRGDVPDWGGTPLGLYKIESKREKVLSLATYTWMPLAMKFSGKYFIHGIPYDDNGKVPTAGYSGGCITLNDETSKFVFDKANVGSPIFVVDNLNDGYKYPLKSASLPDISSSKYIVADINSGDVLLEKQSKNVSSVYKLSYLMEAAIVVENNNLNKNILIGQSMVSNQDTKTVATLGSNMSIVSLFYPLLVESSENASIALGSLWGRLGTVGLMNEKAKTIMMEKTNFVDVEGISEDNVSTAQDLFYLIRYIAQTRPALLKISNSMWARTFGPRPFEYSQLNQQNKFLAYPEFFGGKTAKTKSGDSGIFVFNFKTSDNNKRQIAILILDSQDIRGDLKLLYNWTKNSFFNY